VERVNETFLTLDRLDLGSNGFLTCFCILVMFLMAQRVSEIEMIVQLFLVDEDKREGFDAFRQDLSARFDVHDGKVAPFRSCVQKCLRQGFQ
jgi:hypothetical protein